MTRAEAQQEPRSDRLGRLYSEHAPAAMRLAFLLTGERGRAEDLVQDAFVRIAGRFGHLRIRRSFASYLNRTIVNLARDKGRRSRLEREHRAVPEIETIEQPDLELKDQLLAALRELPARQRAAVVLRYYQDLSEQQVADALDVSISAAKSLITRGMATLRQNIGGVDRE